MKRMGTSMLWEGGGMGLRLPRVWGKPGGGEEWGGGDAGLRLVTEDGVWLSDSFPLPTPT